MAETSNALIPIWYAVSALQGALSAIGFAVLLLFVLSRRGAIFFLGLFALLQLVAQASLFPLGLLGQTLLTDDAVKTWMQFGGLSFCAGVVFSHQMLAPQAAKLSEHKWLILLMVACVVTPLFIDQSRPQWWLITVAALALLFAGVSTDAIRKQKRCALWLGIGWVGIFVTYGCVFLVHGNSVLAERALFTLVLVTGAVAVCSVWLTAVLKSYIDEEKAALLTQQKALALAQAQDQMREQLLLAEETAREELEDKYQERTFELEVTLRELQETNRELEEKNTQDALTGIRNRRFFDKKYLAEFRRSRREQTELSLIILDIDFFKKVNDTYGHLAGDDVIRFVGRTIADLLKRPSDEGCRYGGEEFSVILPNTNAQGALQVAEMLRKRIESSTINTDAGQLKVTVSCGVYTAIAELDMNQNLFIELADKALYHAKQTGRNKVVHYNQIESATQNF